MKAKDFIIIIFSKNRAMQLDLTLKTLKLNCKDAKNINVLYSCDSIRHQLSYNTLELEYPDVIFHNEQSFKNDVLSLLENTKNVMFVCDDCIFTNNFSLKEIDSLLDEQTKAIGFSLRLGTNTQYCYPLDMHQECPACIKVRDNVLMFGWNSAEYDYGYPLELSSSIYRTLDIIPLLQNLSYNNPNQMESVLSQNAFYFYPTRPVIMCYETSVAFCNPINKIQDFNNNRHGTNIEYSSDSLLTKWEKCGRIDISKFNGFVSNSCHQEVNINIIYSDGYVMVGKDG
jgi:hypothetical protein